MLAEFLIVGTCVLGESQGCQTSATQYYQQSPILKEMAQEYKLYGKTLVQQNPWIMYAGVPTYAIFSGQPMRFKIARNTVLRLDTKDRYMSITWSF